MFKLVAPFVPCSLQTGDSDDVGNGIMVDLEASSCYVSSKTSCMTVNLDMQLVTRHSLLLKKMSTLHHVLFHSKTGWDFTCALLLWR